MDFTDKIKSRLAKILGVKLITPEEEEKDEFWASVVFDHAYEVLLSAARPYEPEWTDRTRFTTLGYLMRLAEHFQAQKPIDQQERIARLAYQKFCVKRVSQNQFNTRIARLESSQNKYYSAGREAASLDLTAMSNRKIVRAFFDALQFPSDGGRSTK